MTEILTWHPVGLIGLLFAVLSLLLGVAVAVLAMQGYLRNNARPMLYVAAGFVLVVLVPLVALVGVTVVAEQMIIWSGTAVLQTMGLCLILYGLWKPKQTEIV